MKMDFPALKIRMDREGPEVHLVVHVNQALMEWFVDHVKKIDMVMAVFLKTQKPFP